MLEIKNLRAGYGRTEILSGAELVCETGQITTVIGANGCGKSTLLKTALGMVPISSGDILLDGVSVKTLSPTETARRAAYLSQGKNIPDITVERMVLHGRFPYLSYPRRYRKEDFEAARAAMERMGIAELAEKPLSKLSGGMRQKVYIAMALCQQADILLMDEPTAYLDISHQLKLAQTARELANEGKTVVLVLHDILLALKLSDKIAVLKDGKIESFSSPDTLISSGILERIYGVEVKAIETENGTEYYFK